jgi:hypothetical protein
LDPDVLRLARIKLRMQENLTQLPNYTCVETIERSRRPARSRRFQLADTIRLEVALVDGKELFAWPGAGKFEDRELREMVGGTIGNGSFALHARSVFLSTAPTYQYVGTVEEDGRSLFRYLYDVPQVRSGYRLRVDNAEGATAYRGSFDIDPSTLDLVRLETSAYDIPPHIPLSGASDIMRYQRVPIGDREFLLPQSSVMTLTSLDGTESRNRIHFSGCKQYSGESTISFGDPPSGADAPPAAAPPVPVTLPEGLLVDTRLRAKLPLTHVAVGDPFEIEVTSNAKLKRVTMVPKGATGRGRVTLFRTFNDRGLVYALGLQLEEIAFPGAVAQVKAIPVEINAALDRSRTGVDKQGIIYMRGQRQALLEGTPLVWRIGSPNETTGRESR